MLENRLLKKSCDRWYGDRRRQYIGVHPASEKLEIIRTVDSHSSLGVRRTLF